MLAIGKVTPLSREGQPPWPPFSWLTRPHKEIPVLCIILGSNYDMTYLRMNEDNILDVLFYVCFTFWFFVVLLRTRLV